MIPQLGLGIVKRNFFMRKILLVAFMLLTIPVFSKTALDYFEKGCDVRKPDRKIKYFTKAIKLDPGFILAYKNRAFAMDSELVSQEFGPPGGSELWRLVMLGFWVGFGGFGSGSGYLARVRQATIRASTSR